MKLKILLCWLQAAICNSLISIKYNSFSYQSFYNSNFTFLHHQTQLEQNQCPIDHILHDTKCCSQQRHHHRMQWREMNLFYYFFNRFIVKCLWEFPSCPIPFSVFLRFVCCSLFLLGTDIFLYHSKKKQNDLLSHSVYMWPHKKRGKKSSLYVYVFFIFKLLRFFFFSS